MPGNIIKINNNNELSWYCGDSKMDEVIKCLDEKCIRERKNIEKCYQWSQWQCDIMTILDFRFWFCECHYQSPYGRVIMGGCKKHD